MDEILDNDLFNALEDDCHDDKVKEERTYIGKMGSYKSYVNGIFKQKNEMLLYQQRPWTQN